MITNLYKEEYNNVSFSRAVTTTFMDPNFSNYLGTVQSGEMMKIMDNMAGVVAYKHAKGVVVTARVDEVLFYKPLILGELVTCIGQLIYVGKSSMQVMVNLVIHDINNYSNPETAASALFTMVHLVDSKPARVPQLIASTKEEEELYILGEKVYKQIKSKHLK